MRMRLGEMAYYLLRTDRAYRRRQRPPQRNLWRMTIRACGAIPLPGLAGTESGSGEGAPGQWSHYPAIFAPPRRRKQQR